MLVKRTLWGAGKDNVLIRRLRGKVHSKYLALCRRDHYGAIDFRGERLRNFLLEVNAPSWVFPIAQIRKKETDEVAPATIQSPDSPLHGGDGNSEEVDNASENPERGDFSEVEEEGEKNSENSPSSKGRPMGSPYLQSIKKIAKGEVNSLVSALKRLFKSMRAGQGVGPVQSDVINPVAFAREMFSKRWDISRIYREDSSKLGRIIIAADVSGSCAGMSAWTVGICQAITSIIPDVISITHSNGMIFSVTENGVQRKIKSPTESFSMWEDLGKSCIGALLLGDADGFSHFKVLWEENDIPVVWVDGYMLGRGKVAERNLSQVYGWCDGKPKNLRFFIAADGAADVAACLRMAMRKKGG